MNMNEECTRTRVVYLVVYVCEREIERRRTVMIDTTWRQTHFRVSQKLLLLASFRGALIMSCFSDSGVTCTPRFPLTCLLGGCSPNAWLPVSLESKNVRTIYFLDAHSFILLARFTWFISFFSLFTPVHIL